MNLNTCLLILLVGLGSITRAQTVAMDFTQNDCAGNPHHLFSELDSGYVVVLEFIMTCNSCIVGGHAIEAMMTDIETEYPGKVRFYQVAYTNSYTCTVMQDFKTTNNFSSSTFDQGANMVAYYGGFGMPTVAIVGGQNHGVLYTSVGFSASDTTQAGPAIRDFLATTAVHEVPVELLSINLFPNPAKDVINLNAELKLNSVLTLELVDLNGKLITGLYSGRVSAGEFKQTIDVSSIAAGLYMLKTTISEKSTYSKIRISH